MYLQVEFGNSRYNNLVHEEKWISMTRHHSSVVSIFDIGLQTAFDKDQIKTILKECVEETLGQHTYEHSKVIMIACWRSVCDATCLDWPVDQ